MTRLLLLLILATAHLGAQTITVTTATKGKTTIRTITATAGALTCQGSNEPGVMALRISCAIAGSVIVPETQYAALPGVGVSLVVVRGTASIAWLLTQGNAAPNGWSVSAADGLSKQQKSGAF